MHTVIIAEAGVNHNGDFERARALVDVAAEAGADYVKFQSFKAANLVTEQAEKAPYQAKNSGGGSQLEMLRKLELSPQQHYEIRDHCKARGIGFLSTPFDFESLELLVEMGVGLLKIPSGEITNRPFLEAVADKGLPVVLSTGMSTLGEVEAAVAVLETRLERNQITLLHCNTEYPTPMRDANVRAMQTLASAFGCPVGLSDHTQGVEVSVAAVALGAGLIEKHFTLDKSLPGPDHKASLDPVELTVLVRSIRNVEVALGCGRKRPTDSERANLKAARRSIHWVRDLPAGHRVQAEDLTMKRPGHGISPMRQPDIVGSSLTVPVRAEQMARMEELRFD